MHVYPMMASQHRCAMLAFYAPTGTGTGPSDTVCAVFMQETRSVTILICNSQRNLYVQGQNQSALGNSPR